MKDVTPIIDAMKTVILFREMYDICMNRIKDKQESACIGCPYYAKGTCNKISTIDLIYNVADIFQEFLDEEEE